MHQQTIHTIVLELDATLTGRLLGSIIQPSPLSFVLDFRVREGLYLFVSVDPSLPRLHLISRRVRDLKKQSTALGAFGQALRSTLGSAWLISVSQDESERIVRFSFSGPDDIGKVDNGVLVAQLTGRSANLLLLDAQDRITHSLRDLKGQQIIDLYTPPQSRAESRAGEPLLQKGSFASLSAAADDFYQHLEADRAFASKVDAAGARLRSETARLKKLQQHLRNDLELHGNAEQHKRLGDLLLANIATAERHGCKVRIQDFYADNSPTIEVEVDENSTLQAEAARSFAKYAKAKRATGQIAKRLVEIEAKLSALADQRTVLERIAADHNETELEAFVDRQWPAKKGGLARAGRRQPEKIPGTRRYLSSDGFEILVGRAAKDNDHLTFRVARPHDLWLHAADYPGSHVVVRSPVRQELPHRTVIEAAQLAAKFSQAGNDSKVDVHYTPRKFVSKIKGAAPGLVRLSTFKMITVEPREVLERI